MDPETIACRHGVQVQDDIKRGSGISERVRRNSLAGVSLFNFWLI